MIGFFLCVNKILVVSKTKLIFCIFTLDQKIKMLKKIMAWNDQEDELLCREILLFKPYKFKARTREKGNSWKAIADDLNSLDRFKVDARAVRERYGIIRKKSLWDYSRSKTP